MTSGENGKNQSPVNRVCSTLVVLNSTRLKVILSVGAFLKLPMVLLPVHRPLLLMKPSVMEEYLEKAL